MLDFTHNVMKVIGLFAVSTICLVTLVTIASMCVALLVISL